MALYSGLRPRRTRQMIGDVAVVLWICFWLWQGWSVHHSISDATRATDRAGTAAVALGDHLDVAGRTLSTIPLIGDAAASPFRSAAEAAERMADASELGTETVEHLAWKLGVGTAVTPTVLLLVAWGPRRAEQIRRGSRAWSEAPELLALRALTTQPPSVLATLSPDATGGFLNRDPATIAALARYQMAHDGVPAPASAGESGGADSPASTAPGVQGSGEPPATGPEVPGHG